MLHHPVRITCTATGETIAEVESWGIADALVNYYCDNSTPQWIYDACIELSEAYDGGEDCTELESKLECKIESF